MNNIYVDELPKSCKVCPCLHDEEMCIYCNLDAFDGNNCPYKMLNKERHKDCPLKLLSDRLAEERKKVIQEIKQVCLDEEHKIYDRYDKLNINIINETDTRVIDAYEKVIKNLDKIERGTYD